MIDASYCRLYDQCNGLNRLIFTPLVDAQGLGNVKLKMTFKVSDIKDVTMYAVLYVPKLSGNLFSVGAAARKGNTVQCSSRSLGATSVAMMEIFEEWEHKDLMDCIS